MPVDIGGNRGKNFRSPQLTGPSMRQKRIREALLSSAPGVFNANRPTLMRVNDIANSMGVSGLSGSVKTKKIKRMK